MASLNLIHDACPTLRHSWQQSRMACIMDSEMPYFLSYNNSGFTISVLVVYTCMCTTGFVEALGNNLGQGGSLLPRESYTPSLSPLSLLLLVLHTLTITALPPPPCPTHPHYHRSPSSSLSYTPSLSPLSLLLLVLHTLTITALPPPPCPTHPHYHRSPSSSLSYTPSLSPLSLLLPPTHYHVLCRCIHNDDVLCTAYRRRHSVGLLVQPALWHRSAVLLSLCLCSRSQ